MSSNGSILVNTGKQIMLERTYDASTSVTAPTQFKIGILNDTPNVTDTGLDVPVPYDNGTVNDDGANQMTGSNGGDDTSDNTTTYKEGSTSVATDFTAQNLITNTSSATKQWTISDLASAGTVIDSSLYLTAWLYITDATTLAYFVTSGTAVEIRVGSDSSNYFSLTREASELSVGWNWISSYPTATSALTETGTVGATIEYFSILITTNNATDSWAEEDVVYDLLRTFQDSDFNTNVLAGYPTVDTTNLEVETRVYLNTLVANGFDINGLGIFNTDATPTLFAEDTYTAESKSQTDTFTYIIKDRIV